MIINLKVATKKGSEPYKLGGVCDLSYPSSTKRRSRSKKLGQIAGTIAVVQEHFVIEERKDMDLDNGLKVRIRRLTPRECWRLMGFTDEDFEKAKLKFESFDIEGSDKKCCAKLKVANEKPIQKDTETYVYYTIKDSHEMVVISKELMKYTKDEFKEKMQNVSFVIEKSDGTELSECATSTIKCLGYTETLYILTEGKDQQVMDIIVSVKGGNTNTEKYMKITTESNLPPLKLFIILTLTKQIIESKIFGSTTIKANTQGCITDIELCENYIRMTLSSLKMDRISERTSDTEMYKQAGNSICVPVLENIFKQLIPEGERNNDNR